MSTVAFNRLGTYSVPRRFGLRSVLVVTAGFGLMSAVVRSLNQPLAVPLFYAVFAVVIALAQMVFEKWPRSASIAAGAIYLPICFHLEPALREHFSFSPFGERFLMLVLAGGFLAYLGGTLIAGVYLIVDLVSWLARAARIAGPKDADLNGAPGI